MKVRRAVLVSLIAIIVLAVLFAATIKGRGFRASSDPSALESAIARWIRNFAIPNSERNRKNPVAGDPVSLARGGDLFLARCASCHGVDGTANPAIAKMMKVEMRNLQSADVQAMGDDELKKIIVEGKGKMKPMPAVAASAADIVAYERSLKK